MIVKIINQKTKDFDLYGCDSASVKHDVTDEINLDENILEDDLGVFDIDATFPMFLSNESKTVLEKCGSANIGPCFALLSLNTNGIFKNLVVDTNKFDVYILENGKTVDRV
jgi:hypothetical protein